MLGEIRNAQGELLDYAFHPGTANSQNIVVIGHGVTGNKDRPFVVALGAALEQADITALRFSFSGNGDSAGAFTDSTISKEVEDLGALLDALSDHTVCYIGHSMGGAVGVMRASTDPRIKYLVSLAGMVHTAKFAAVEFGDATPDAGFMWDEEDCPLAQKYVDDMNQIDSVVELGAQVRVPWLLVHGSEDDVVPIEESYDIIAKANQPNELFVIEGSNHVFSEHTEVMVEKVVAWVKEQFGT